jgi:threonine dehydrogenase-like Zn-dependent dehydrogenase
MNMANAAANIIEDRLGEYPDGTAVKGNVSNYGIQHEFADPSGAKMKALVWEGKNRVKVVETAKPRLINDEDAIIKVTGTTICGSDLHLYHGAIIEMRKGDILGHEYMGIVESVGPKVKKIKPGDRVVASFQIACGKCRFCTQKLTSQCERTNPSSVANAMYGHRTAGIYGYSHLTGGYAGGQAEYVRAPFADVGLLVVPDGVTDERVLYLSDVLPTSYNCVEDTHIYGGETVGIWGMGPVGLFTAKWAFVKGANRVIAIDQVGWRLEYAKSKIPELETLDFSKVKSVPEELKKLAPGGLDVALECAAGEYAKSTLHKVETAIGLETDSSDILNEMILSVRPYGRIGVTGVYAGYTNHFNIGAIMQTGIRLIGNGQAPVLKYWETILNDYVLPGKIDPNMMITHRIPLEEMEELYARFDKRDPKDRIMKVFVATKFSNPPGEGSPQLSSLKA